MRMAGDGNLVNRKRKAHAKSRRGCRNCKLRRVKCDERRPRCNKCSDFGVTCNFDPNVPDLEMSACDGFIVESVNNHRKLPKPPNQIALCRPEIPQVLYPALDSTLQLDRELLDRFTRFHERTVFSMGTPEVSVLFRGITAKLAFAHPYLMHITQTLTATHDRYLSNLPLSMTSKQSAVESYHLSQTAALLNKKLSSAIFPEDCDPLWATAALLGIVAFATIEASTPEEAWPLKISEPSDFEWINMSEHKAAVWKLTTTVKPIIAVQLAANVSRLIISLPDSGIENVPSRFAKLYELDASSTVNNSPYFEAVHKIVLLLDVKCEPSNFPRFLGFIGHMQPEFKNLLYQKDPRALLLLVYWYAIVGGVAWHLERRTKLQGQATCLYLERYHPNETAIHELLDFPKLKLGSLVNGGLPTPPSEEEID